MCAACVAQGVAYVGVAASGLQVLKHKARRDRGRLPQVEVEVDDDRDESQAVSSSMGSGPENSQPWP